VDLLSRGEVGILRVWVSMDAGTVAGWISPPACLPYIGLRIIRMNALSSYYSAGVEELRAMIFLGTLYDLRKKKVLI